VEIRNTLNVAPDFCAPSLVDVLETVLLCGCGNWDQQLLQGREGGKGIRLKQVNMDRDTRMN